MKKKLLIILSYIIFFFNSNVLTSENNKTLKVGLLAPLSGEYKELGESLLYTLQLALDELMIKMFSLFQETLVLMTKINLMMQFKV